MKRPAKLLSIFGILLAMLTSCHQKEKPPLPPPEVTAFQVQAQTIPADFDFVGVAKSSHPVEIRSRVEGYLLSIDYTEGSMVDENTLLFKIDPRQFEASLQEAQGELERQEAILWRAQHSFERIEPLYVLNAASRRDLDNATAQVLSAEASVLAAKGNLINAQLNLSYTNITSPIKGLTSRAAYREGTLITPSINGLLTLVSVIDPIWVLFSVSDNALLQAQGQKANSQLIMPEKQNYKITLELADGSQFPHSGVINFAAPILDPQTGSLVVRGEFPNPEGKLLPGQFVHAKVSGAMRPNALFIPQQAVAQGQKGMYVFVIGADNKVTARTVEVGDWYKNYWIITKGLNEGDLVVADGINKIREGTQVKIIATSKPEPAK